MNDPIEQLFSPRTVAIVGARPELTKPGGRCLAFLKRYGFRGRIFPVNPRYEEIDGMRCFPTLAALPESPDLVMLIVPAATVIEHLDNAAHVGARAAVVFSSGFAEAGVEGQALQDRLIEAAGRLGIAVLGPNCLGLINLQAGLIASFTSALVGEVELDSGPAALVSQSGAMGMAVFTLAQREGLGVGKFLSTGNEAVLGLTDFVEYLSTDADTSLILGYVEGLRDGRRFVDVARGARRAGKAVGLLKVGRSEVGELAARSHTGALSGSDKVYEAAFRRAGVLSADTVQDLVDLIVVSPGARRAEHRGVGIVSMSGGAGVMMADACSVVGLDVATLTQGTLGALAQLLPSYATFTNPVDFGAIYDDLDKSLACVEVVAKDPGVAQVLMFIGMSPSLLGVVEERLARIQASVGKPLIVAWLAGPPDGLRALRAAGVAAFDDPTRAVRAAAALAEFGRPLGGLDVVIEGESDSDVGRATREQLRAFTSAGRTTLSEREVKALLASYNMPVIQEFLASSAAEAIRVAGQFKRLLAIKAEAPDLLHKSDSGAVCLNVSPDSVAVAYHKVMQAAANVVGEDGVRGVLIQPMALPGVEVLAGVRFDPQFGPTITVGLGGVTSEVLADATTELAPIDLDTARSMVARLKGAPLLGAFRGAPPKDVEALAMALVALSNFAVDAGSLVSELDLNPIIVHEVGQGCTLVDGAALL